MAVDILADVAAWGTLWGIHELCRQFLLSSLLDALDA
jgi:hypothetical protein